VADEVHGDQINMTGGYLQVGKISRERSSDPLEELGELLKILKSEGLADENGNSLDDARVWEQSQKRASRMKGLTNAVRRGLSPVLEGAMKGTASVVILRAIEQMTQ
jgi:hypothetical protein